MSKHQHSMRRWGLLAGISLIAVAAAAALWQIQLRTAPATVPDLATYSGAAAGDQMLVSHRLAARPPYSTELQSDQDATAVLFLIDESGGVSGRCGNVEPSSVRVTDAEGHRHELVRFYLQLWRAYHAFLRDRGKLDGASPLIQMGVMQFAKENEPQVLLDITPIGDLLDDLGATTFARLQSQDTMLTGIDANWFCWTDFSSALDGAAEKLNNSGAESKTLVLLTDGSTRGNENEQECEENNEECLEARLAARSTAREAIERSLRRLQTSHIEPLVVIWQGNDCREEDPCGLSDNEFSMRKDDLARWESWERAGLLDLINDEQAIRALAETTSFSTLLPGVGQFATGWIDGATDQTISDVARLLKVVIITSDKLELSDIHFRPHSINDGGPPIDYAELVFQSHEPQWYSAERDIQGSSAACPQRALEIRVSKPVLAYYWLPFEQDWPKIKTVSVEPQDLMIGRLSAGVISPEDRTIEVSVVLEPIDMNHHNCFVAQVLVAGKVYSDTLPRNDSALLFSDIILPDDLAHGPMAITANLVFANAPEVLAGVEKSTEINVDFRPIFPEKVDVSSSLAATTSEGITVTIPITFAEQIPGFAVRFGLFQDQFDPQGPFPTPPKPTGPAAERITPQGCPPTSGFDDAVEYLGDVTKATGSVNNLVTNYSFVIKDYIHALMACEYRALLVEWSRSSNEQDSSDQVIYQWINIAGVPEQPPPPRSMWELIWAQIKAWFSDLFSSKQAQ